MKMKNTLLVTALAASGLLTFQANASAFYGTLTVNEALEGSINEMMMAKLQASFFSGAALYMDVNNTKKHSASPNELKKQLESAYKNTKYSLSERQELVDAYSEVSMVVGFLETELKSEGIANQKMVFCSASVADAKDWPGIDDVIAKYPNYSITQVPLDIIYAPLSDNGDCGDASSWASKLTKTPSKSDAKAIPTNLIAYSSSVGNSSGELVYIFENSIHEDGKDSYTYDYETFTFYQSNSEGTPEDGIFRRYRKSNDGTDEIEKIDNVSCKKCGSESETFKIESKKSENGTTQHVAGTAVKDNNNKFVPGFVSESKNVYIVDHQRFNDGSTSTFIDLLNPSKGIVEGRKDDTPGAKVTLDTKSTNLMIQFGIKDEVNAQCGYPTAINIKGDNTGFSVTGNTGTYTSSAITDTDDKTVLGLINNLTLTSITESADKATWEKQVK